MWDDIEDEYWPEWAKALLTGMENARVEAGHKDYGLLGSLFGLYIGQIAYKQAKQNKLSRVAAAEKLERTCVVDGCINEKVDGHLYCRPHKCGVRDCENRRLHREGSREPISLYCELHHHQPPGSPEQPEGEDEESGWKCPNCGSTTGSPYGHPFCTECF